MNFSEFILESAIEINKSMKDYAENLLKKILKIVDEHVTYTYLKKELNNKHIFTDEIDTKYGKFVVYSYLKFDTHHKALAGKGGQFKDENSIMLNLDEHDYNELKQRNKETISEHIRIIHHELVHIIDPKLNKPELLSKTKEQNKHHNLEVIRLKKELNTEKDPEKLKELEKELDSQIKKYYKFPWEIDAYISSEAEDYVQKILKFSRTKREALNYVKQMVPRTQVERIYLEDEIIKKRYIKYITKLIDKEFE